MVLFRNYFTKVTSQHAGSEWSSSFSIQWRRVDFKTTMNYEKCLPCLQSSKLVFPRYKGVERSIAKYSPLQHVLIIVNRGDWLWSPANIKQANKDAKIYVGRSTREHNPLFCTHTLCMNYVTNTFLLVISSTRSKKTIVFCARSRPKKRPKTYNKELCRVS